MDMIVKTDVELENGAMVDVCCFDGIGIAIDIDEDSKFYILTYPKLKELTLNEDDIKEVLTHCGLYDLTAKDIHYGDIMLTYGEIVSNANRDDLRGFYDEICRTLTDMETSDEKSNGIAYDVLLKAHRRLVKKYDF